MSNKIDIHNIVLQLTKVTLLEDKRHRDESIRNLTPISTVHEGGSIKENTFTVSKCTPKYSSNKTIIDDLITYVENEHLFNIYKLMPNRDFHISLNKNIYDFLLRKSNEAKETNTWGDDNIWYNPIKEFQNWFDENGIDHNTIPSLAPDNGRKRKQRKNKGGRKKGSSPNMVARVMWIRDKYQILKDKDSGENIKERAELIASEMRKLQSEEKLPDFFEGSVLKHTTVYKYIKTKLWKDITPKQ